MKIVIYSNDILKTYDEVIADLIDYYLKRTRLIGEFRFPFSPMLRR